MLSKEFHIQSTRNRLNFTLEQCIDKAYVINNYIQLNKEHVTLYKVNVGTLEVITWLSEDYIQYDFHGLMNTYEEVVGTGYYWKQRLQKDDARTGRRKCYYNTKGIYFMENGYRNYLDDYILNH